MTRSPFAIAADIIDPPPHAYAGRPRMFVRETLGEFIWSKQEEILASIWANQKTAVPSCFGIGKSFIAARAIAAWIETHPPGEALVITTSTTFRQVKHILWKEIRRAHSKGHLRGRVNQTEWYVDVLGGEEIVAFGMKPADQDPAAFQGHHATYVLVVIDEADGVSQLLFDASEGLIVNPHSRLLATGNPWNPTGPFAKICKPGSGWNVIRVRASDTPNFTGEDVPEKLSNLLISKAWVKDKLRIWGKDDPRYISKVDAEFPEDAENTLVHLFWVEDAQKARVRKTRPIELGVDVGGDTGGDETVMVLRRGKWARTVWASRRHDTVEIANAVADIADEMGVSVIRIDATGIGKGVYDNLRHRRYPVVPVNFGSSPRDPDFAYLGDELGWNLREIFRTEEVDIDEADDELATQLVNRRWGKTVKGKIKLESKDEMRRRGLPSPDRFDAHVLAFAPIAGGHKDDAPQRAASKKSAAITEGLMDEDKVGF